MRVTKECLDLGIEKAVAGMRIGDIGYAVQEHAEKQWFWCSEGTGWPWCWYKTARKT